MPKSFDMYDLEKYLPSKHFVCCKTLFKARCCFMSEYKEVNLFPKYIAFYRIYIML